MKRKTSNVKRRRRRKGTGFTSTIRASASRKAEYENRLGLTWRSRAGTLRERDFEALDRNLRGVSKAGRKLERLLFGRRRRTIESSAYDFVGKEI